MAPYIMVATDLPNTIASTVYKTQFKPYSAYTTGCSVQTAGANAYIILIEVAT
jgi:hypothetical protein